MIILNRTYLKDIEIDKILNRYFTDVYKTGRQEEFCGPDEKFHRYEILRGSVFDIVGMMRYINRIAPAVVCFINRTGYNDYELYVEVG